MFDKRTNEIINITKFPAKKNFMRLGCLRNLYENCFGY
jgi:hypothetical protein